MEGVREEEWAEVSVEPAKPPDAEPEEALAETPGRIKGPGEYK
jgi:hypothetical protein